ncbi:Rna binding protein nrd1 [Neofusicoccum parvum]|uniref:Rna binding protein nrd1 n=1 Tax=Neofusicoccum parvum TaxID=310453 RepID=A0ACB5SG88_9PEZI|nr:Rna binding protein nrd1 [Neofusicoccum parvum]
MSAIDELNTLLLSLSALKPPGANKSKITAITNLCIANANQCPLILQTIRDRFNTSPHTHKLGVLYVLDAVVRQWADKARMNKEDAAAAGSDVSKAPNSIGVAIATQVLPPMMHDLIQTAPEDQKDRIGKMIEIWERGNTFPQQMLADFKQRLGARPSMTAPSMPSYAPQPNGQGNTTTTPAAAPAASAPANPFMPQAFQNMPGGNEAFMQFIGSLVQQGWTPEQIAQIIAAMSGGGQTQPGMPGAPAVPQAPQAQNGHAQGGPNGQSLQPGEQIAQDYRSRDDPRDLDRTRDRSRSPDSKRRRGSPVNRRESPTYGVYEPYSIPGAPDGPAGGPSSANGQQPSEHSGGRRGGRKNRRNRDKHRNSPAVQQQQQQQQQQSQQSQQQKGQNQRPKYIQHDPTLPRNNIKVLSRTLFVGGVSATEPELRQIFSRFGEVQTCIVNPEKHHAFVKMANRTDSVAAKLGMEKEKSEQVLKKARQTRWGVGFGPRECSDYSTGISVIPIDRLTEADRKWVVTSEFGGTGGRTLETGLVIEEPDIEIGTGVSSKAMSRRVGPEPAGKGGHGHFHGGRRHHHGGHHGGGGFNPDAPRFRKPDPRPGGPQGGEPRPEPHTIGVPPAVPGFGFQLPGM